jgi:hypothetical protein
VIILSSEYKTEDANVDVARFRSFAERYVIERASTFKGETEMEDAWNAVERAKSIYKHIENVANVEDNKDMIVAHGAMQAAGQVTAPAPVSQVARHPTRAGRVAAAINSQSWTGRK